MMILKFLPSSIKFEVKCTDGGNIMTMDNKYK